MADLRSKQLKDGFQNLVTIGATTTSDPTTGALTNGKDTAITQVTLGLGSTSAPSYSFTGDTDTGMFSSGANALNLVTGSNSRMIISSTGNISIGTTNSSAKLHVESSSAEILRLERDTTSNDSFIDLTYASGHNNDSDANHEYSKIRTKVVANLSGSESSELHFQTINSGTIGDKMVITKEGNIGIGTDTPDQLLHLKGTSPFMSISHSSDNSTSGILFRRTDNDQNRGNILYDFANDAMTFRVSTNGTGESMRITSAGSVGIGETSVDAKLHLTTATAGLVNQKFESAGGAAWRLGVPASQTYFAFDNANDDLSSPKLVIDTNGKVGIGTASPSQKLEVHDASSTTTSNDGGVGIVIKNTNSTDNNQGSLEFQNSAGTKTASIISTFTDHSSNEGQLSFCTGPGGGTFAEAMRIDANGRVGIGVTSPSLALEVSDNNTNGVLGVKNTSNDRNTFKSSNAAGTRTLDIGNNSSGHGILNIRNSSGTVNTQLLGSGDSYFNGGDVLIGKTSSGIAVDGVEFNTSSHFTNFTRERNSSGGTIMQVNRTGSEDGSVISFMRSGSEKGSISVTSSATAFNTSSDYRLKENITSLSSCLDTVSKIKPSTFNFIDTPNQTVDGFIAHELAEVVPQAVSGEKDGIDEHGEPIYQGVDHSKLVPLLVGAIQELKAEIEQLKNK